MSLQTAIQVAADFPIPIQVGWKIGCDPMSDIDINEESEQFFIEK